MNGLGAHPRAQVVGTGLVGGSLGMALRRRGWTVTGTDADAAHAARALQLGALDADGFDDNADLVFVATPAGSIVDQARKALRGRAVVTDVAGVKDAIVAAVAHPRFVGGHPMAGSEQDGVDGADPDLFVGATWVLTPTEVTDPDAYTLVAGVVGLLGATPVALPPRRHDDLVAMVSHVPHLTATSLMNLAAEASVEHGTLLRLAAGGFRDMTRIAAGHPGIWPDICVDNRDGILEALDGLTAALAHVRRLIAEGDRRGLLSWLESAREARVNLPSAGLAAGESVELRIPVPDRPGVFAEVTTLLGEMGVNIYDMEITHSVEGDRGVLMLVIASSALDAVRTALNERAFRVSHRRLGP
ncbi:MAG: prephenate dehydrogenase/arogenate dehydrogenase family protein [Actinomycetota bacterium]|nr:prephenate dehydrogenase/arogenate dehydrogenase family protein [Actinomycetota bacterium]